MGIRQYKPVTAGRRGGAVSDFSDLTRTLTVTVEALVEKTLKGEGSEVVRKVLRVRYDDGRVRQIKAREGVQVGDRIEVRVRPERKLLRAKPKKGGRNNQGVICVRFRGGGHKKLYRLIDFKRRKDNIWATVLSIEYDPNRTARIARVLYEDKEVSYILAPEGLKVGDRIQSGAADVEPRVGNCMPLSKIPLGLTIHNVELQPGHGGQLCRSAGTSATLGAREGKWAQITLPSGEMRRISSECRATIGAIGNAEHMNITLGKAGRKRWMGRKPHNRGTSMKPVNHPMGGGEGRTAGGRHPCSPTGVLAKGGKTRKKRKPSNAAIIRGRRRGAHNP